MAASSGIEVLRTPYKAHKANAICERFLGSVRRECLDHVLVLGERHVHRVMKEYVQYYNRTRPHQVIEHQIPQVVPSPVQAMSSATSGAGSRANPKISSLPVLGGLHHDYKRAA